jgi:nucleotide-binding universal stress UspA family protein
MGTYKVVAVGTDGSESSFRAVDRAAVVAADASATLLIICAYRPSKDASAHDSSGDDADVQVVGSTPAEESLRDARQRAAAKGVTDVDTIAVEGDPVEVVISTVVDRRADLVVVGNRGLNSLAGRLLGSVPQGVSRRAGADVLIVHTT